MILAESRVSVDGLETGGILLGHDHESQQVMEVTRAGDPGPTARRERRWFLRDLKHAQGLGDIAYEEDGSVWIGEWHTHTNASPLPSPRDLSTYLMILSDPSLDFTRFASIIVTADSDQWDVPIMWPWLIRADAVQLSMFLVEGSLIG